MALALALSACSGEPDEENTVSFDAGTATVSAGERLWVDFGWVNFSVGDNWSLVGEPDAGVLAEFDRYSQTHPDCEDGMAGCESRLYWVFDAVAEGETTLVFQYCFRTGPEDCVGDAGDSDPPEPVELTVEVTG
ncbi:hypothetical protein GCM10027447_14240 [Glycomyces halotolerans]